jgi:ABC-type transport system substrate-binding protein
MNRRKAMTTAGYAAVGAAAVVVIGGVAYTLTQQPSSTITPASTVTVTKAQTLTETAAAPGVTVTAQGETIRQTVTVAPPKQEAPSAPTATISEKGPYVDRVVFRIMSADAAVLALQGGEVDLIEHSLTNTALTALQGNPEVTVESVPSFKTSHIMWNQWGVDNQGPDSASSPGCAEAISDDAFRWAFNVGVIGDLAWLKPLYGDKSSYDLTHIGKVYGDWHNPDVAKLVPKQDAAEANRLLDEAGYVKGADGFRTSPTGNPIDLQLTYDSASAEQGIRSRLMSQSAAAIGIKLTPVAGTSGSTVGQQLAANYDLTTGEGIWMDPAPDFPMTIMRGAPRFLICQGDCNAENDVLIDQFLSSTTESEAKGHIHELQKRLYQASNPFQVGYLNAVDPHSTKTFTGWVNTPGVGVTLNRYPYINVRRKDGRMGGQLNVALAGDPGANNPFGPFYVHLAQGIFGGTGRGLVYESLASANNATETKGLTPLLAESWDTENEGTGGAAVTFNLVKGVKWHDGEALTSEDVKFSIETYMTKAWSIYNWRVNLAKITSMDTPDDNTLVAHCDTRSIFLPRWMTGLPIVPKHKWADIADPQLYDDPLPIGSGPFTYKEWRRGEYIILEKNADYRNLPDISGTRWA